MRLLQLIDESTCASDWIVDQKVRFEIAFPLVVGNQVERSASQCVEFELWRRLILITKSVAKRVSQATRRRIASDPEISAQAVAHLDLAVCSSSLAALIRLLIVSK